LKAVLEVALRFNPSFVEFTAHRDRARAAVMEALAWRNPEVDAGLKYVSGNGDDVEYTFTVRQSLEAPIKRRTRREAAAAGEAVVEQEENSFKVILRAEVARAYWTVKYRDETIILANKNYALAEEIVAIVKKRVAAGSGRPIDITRAEVEMFKAKKQIQSEQRLLNMARTTLNAWCGRGLPNDFELVDDLPTHFTPIDADLILAQAQQHHPELQRLSALRKQKELELDRERVAWYPDFSPGIGFDRETDADRFVVSIGVDIPLWNKNKSGIARAQADLHQVEAHILQTNQTIIRDVEMVTEMHAGALEQLVAFEQFRVATAEALKTETFLYDQGEVDFISLLDVRRTAQDTESQYLATLYDAKLALLEIEKTIGKTGDEK
jgi:cobalt-zinc-cadmium efflux system outer membrane protein